MISVRYIDNGRRLHLQHGPIDLIIAAQGPDTNAAFNAAIARFETILQPLVDELSLLRAPTGTRHDLQGPVARRMLVAASQFSGTFSTPMIAVAGSVADEILQAMCVASRLSRAYVNNGGDIALHLAHGSSYTAGIVNDPLQPEIHATVTVESTHGVHGIATSGRHGRSLSLGIADAVTVMASTAAIADTAATLIANSVNIAQCHWVTRVAAEEVDPDTDLTGEKVVVDVGRLPLQQVNQALDNGVCYARHLQDQGLISAAYLSLHGETRTLTGTIDVLQPVKQRELAHA